MSRPVTLPPPLRSAFASLAARARLLLALRGTGVLLFALSITAGAALAADFFLDLPPRVRQGVFVAWAGLALFLLWKHICRPVLRRLDNAALAAAVEQTYPALGERLTSAVELDGKDDPRHGAPAFVALLIADTEKAARRLNFLPAVPSRPAKVATVAAGVALLLLLTPAVAGPAEYGDLVYRFLFPWYERSPYTYTISPGDVAVARGSSVTVEVTVHPRNGRVPLPGSADLVLTDAEGHETTQRMRADRSDVFSLPLVVSGDCSYRVEARVAPAAPPAASETHKVTAVLPVELAPDSPAVTVTPPEYARGSRETETLYGLVDLTALRGSTLHFALRFSRPAVDARLEWSGADAKTTSYPLALTDDGRAAELTLAATASGSYRLVLEAEYGVRTKLEGGTLTVKPDEPPTVIKFTGREDLKAVTPYDKIPLECDLADDVGVAKAEVEYRVNEGKPALEPFPLTGAGRLEASGQLAFALDGKTIVKDGDTLSYRLRVEDNFPKEVGGPHVVYFPPDRWLTLKVARQPGPVREQEIAAQRDALDRRIEAIKQAILQEMRGLYKLKLESRVEPTLSPEQRDALKALETENQGAEKLLRELVKEAEATPALVPLAEQARDIADKEMQQSEAALRGAGAARMAPADRDGKFKQADGSLSGALQKLEDMKKQNEQIAKERADQLRLEALAEKEQKLADKAGELAKKDPVRDPSAREEAEKLRREQAETAEELQRLAEQSPKLQKSLDEARAEQAKRSAEQARALAESQRSLADAQAEAEKSRSASQLANLAEKQRELADKADKLAAESRQAARTGGVQPLRPDEAKQASSSLKNGDAEEAARHQERSARDLDRLADGLDRSIDLARDPREAARQLARLQDNLRQRVQDEMYRKNADKPLPDRLADLAKEQEAIRKAAEALSMPPEDKEAAAGRQQATDKAAQAARMLRNEEARPALGQMEQTKQALEQLSNRLPSLVQRQEQAAKEVSRMRQRQDDIARDVDQAVQESRNEDNPKAREALKQKLTEAARRQAEIADKLGKYDTPAEEARRDRAAAALDGAASDLKNVVPEDAGASQQQARRELERLEQALRGLKPADEKARELARRQQDLAAEAAGAGTATDRRKDDLRRKQKELANEVNGLTAPEAPQRQAEAAEAANRAAKSAETDPTTPEAREKMETAARKLDALARQMNGRESEAARADRLARRQAEAAAEAEKKLKDNPDVPATPEALRRQDEIAREAKQLRGGEEGRDAKRRAEGALEESQSAARPQERATAQRQAATALRELADKLAGQKDERKPGETAPGTARAAPDPATPSPKGMPTRELADQARQLANEQKDLRDAVRKANGDLRSDNKPPREDPLGELAKQQSEVARRTADLSQDVSRGQGEESRLAKQADGNARSTREAADRMLEGSVPAAQTAGKRAADGLRQLAEGLSRTPRGEGEDAEKDLLRQARDLAHSQEEINQKAARLIGNPEASRARQQARQQELQKEAGGLQKELEKLSQEMNRNRQAGQAAAQAAGAAREAQGQMDQARQQDGNGDAAKARQSQQRAARSLDNAARQADRAASEQAAANDGQRQQGQEGQQGSAQTGQSVRQAKGQMDQAQNQLGQSQTGNAQQSMENAAKALRQAAGQMSQGTQQAQSGNPGQQGPAGSVGAQGGGRPDPSTFGPGISKYAGKTWGELPGELKTKIVQDMREKYGEDYARMIKMYFEQLADTKRDGK
jgi:hypothetical protein